MREKEVTIEGFLEKKSWWHDTSIVERVWLALYWEWKFSEMEGNLWNISVRWVKKMELVLFNSEWGPWRDSTQVERLRLYYLFWKGWAKLESFRAGKQRYERKVWELEEKSRICDVREVSHVISDSNRCKIQLWWMEYDILSPRSYNDHLLSTESENVQ